MAGQGELRSPMKTRSPPALSQRQGHGFRAQWAATRRAPPWKITTICKVHRLIHVGYFYLLRLKNYQCLELQAGGGGGKREEKQEEKGGGEEVERWGKERKQGGGRGEQGV